MAERRRARRAVLAATIALTLGGCSGTTWTVRSPTGPSSAAQSRHTRLSAPSANAAPTDHPTAAQGTLLTRSIPGGRTGFAARPAVIYLPPAARIHPRERFPVLVLLHGTPGAPSNWTVLGAARATLDRFAAAHGGRAPVVVMPDVNGSVRGDTECIRTPNGGDVERYLESVVPAWIGTHLLGSRTHSRWGIAGVSEGGTCALMVALRRPGDWSFIGDFSGSLRPTVGDTDDPATTTARLFGGSTAAFDAHDPTRLLRRRRYPGLSVWFEGGARNREDAATQARLAALARPSVGAVHNSSAPGGHSWAVWRGALASALPSFWAWSA